MVTHCNPAPDKAGSSRKVPLSMVWRLSPEPFYESSWSELCIHFRGFSSYIWRGLLIWPSLNGNQSLAEVFPQPHVQFQRPALPWSLWRNKTWCKPPGSSGQHRATWARWVHPAHPAQPGHPVIPWWLDQTMLASHVPPKKLCKQKSNESGTIPGRFC